MRFMAGKSPEKNARLAAALRENLKRRKARDRALAKDRPSAAADQDAIDPGERGRTGQLRPNPAARDA
jgi:hypothetical protein